MDGKNVEPYDMVEFLKTTSLKVKKLQDVPEIYKKKNIRMTLDYQEDFEFFKTVIEGVLPRELSLDNINNFLYNNPSVKDINYFLDKEWENNQKKIKHFKIKQHV